MEMTQMGDIGAWALAVVAGWLLRGLWERERRARRVRKSKKAGAMRGRSFWFPEKEGKR
jgi:hypothetical protein